jgi:SPP1 gp7 family putative phage head morphogenesis protein
MSAIDDLLVKIFARYYASQANIFRDNAKAAYYVGQYMASKGMGMPIDPTMNIAANAYAKEYEQLLIEEGGTIINGTLNPWYRDSTDEQRRRVAEIIKDGIAQGKATGVREKASGGYPKGTIAEELHSYFDTRRSHASTVARTEVGRIKNIGAIDRYKDNRVEEVVILDNEGPHSCTRCGEMNGKTVTVEWAEQNELEHPNCVRAFRPVIRGFKRIEAK